MPILKRRSNTTQSLNEAIVKSEWTQATSIIQSESELCQKWSISPSFFGYTTDILPIHQACAMESVPLDFIVNLIVAYPEAATKIEQGQNRIPLHIAVKSRVSEEAIRFLIQSYPDGVRKMDLLGRIPLHYAVSNHLPTSIVRSLVEACPGSLGAVDNLDWTPLHVAAYVGASTDIVSFLVQSRPDIVATKNNAGWTPLRCAQESNTRNTDTIVAVLAVEEKKFQSSPIVMNFLEAEQKIKHTGIRNLNYDKFRGVRKQMTSTSLCAVV